MSLHRAAYLAILDEIRKDLPWLIQVWLHIRGKDNADGSKGPDTTSVGANDLNRVESLNVGSEGSTTFAIDATTVSVK